MKKRVTLIVFLVLMSWGLLAQRCKLDESRVNFIKKTARILVEHDINLNDQLELIGIQEEKNSITRELVKILRSNQVKERRNCEVMFASYISEVEEYLIQLESIGSKYLLIGSLDSNYDDFFDKVTIISKKGEGYDSIVKFLQNRATYYGDGIKDKKVADQIKLSQLNYQKDSLEFAESSASQNLKTLTEFELELVKEKNKKDQFLVVQSKEMFDQLIRLRADLLRSSNILLARVKPRK